MHGNNGMASCVNSVNILAHRLKSAIAIRLLVFRGKNIGYSKLFKSGIYTLPPTGPMGTVLTVQKPKPLR